MLPILFLVLISLFAASCSSNESPLPLEKEDVNNIAQENDLHETIVDRFSPPLGYTRVSLEKNSFGYYLQHLPLKEKNALRTVGYQELFPFFENQIQLEEAIDEIKKNTRRYAKRQLTWFKKDTEIHWFAPESQNEIIAFLSNHLGI